MGSKYGFVILKSNITFLTFFRYCPKPNRAGLFSGWQRRSVDDGYDDSWSGVDRGGLWQTTFTRSLHSSLSLHPLDIRYIARHIRMKIRRFLCLKNILNLFKLLAWESAAEVDTSGRRWNTHYSDISATV